MIIDKTDQNGIINDLMSPRSKEIPKKSFYFKRQYPETYSRMSVKQGFD